MGPSQFITLRQLDPEGFTVSSRRLLKNYLHLMGIENVEKIMKGPYQIMWEEFWKRINSAAGHAQYTRGFLLSLQRAAENQWLPKSKWLREMGGF